MALGINEIKESLRKQTKRPVINKASLLQKRLRFHTETSVSCFDAGSQATLFLDWVRSLLPLDKYNVFVQLFRFPLHTTSLVEELYHDLERVFYARNASCSYQFTDKRYYEDWLTYKTSSLNEPEIWKTKGWREMQVSPNSILVVDLPAEQTTPYPEPYFYWLEIDDVIDYDIKDSAFQWLIFKQPDKRIAVFDKDSITVYQLDKHNELIETPISQAKHSLGYCPARFYWSSFINSDNKDIKRNPITKKLSDLDWLLFFTISKRHLDTYAPYPIYSAYKADCDFENNETGEYCDGGFLRDRNSGDYLVLSDGTVKPCPLCSKRRIAGAGSFIEVPIPNQAEGIADLREPVQITTIDRESLDYNVDECKRLEQEIKTAVCGMGGTVQDREAINETQVAANFESKTAVLNALKTNFEEAQRFVDDTVCRLRYGEDFVGSSISWGTEFYVFTVEELYSKYRLAKESGASNAELDSISEQIMEVEYKNNPTMLQRMKILKQLEPYPHNTVSELRNLVGAGLASTELVTLKVNFNTYVDRFERENIDIVEFASSKPLNEKIDIIYSKLLEYANTDQRRIASEAESRQRQEGKAGGGEEGNGQH